MIPGTNGTIAESEFSDEAKLIELKQVEAQLDSEFELYKPSITWIMTVANLLRKYRLLSGKDYEIKTTEDSII